MRIHCHDDATCDVIWHAFHSGCKEQHCGTDLDHPGDVFHLDFHYGNPAYFDVTVYHLLQDSLPCLPAATTGVAAEQGEPDKDSHHAATV